MANRRVIVRCCGGVAVLALAGAVAFNAQRPPSGIPGGPLAASVVAPTARSTDVTVSAVATAPTASPAASEGPSSRPATPAASPSSVHGPSLVAGPYGFPVPAGWTLTPLVARTALVQTAQVVDPAGAGRLDYLVDTSSAIYNPDRTANLAAVAAAIPAAFPCTLTGYAYVANRGPRYTCAPQAGRTVAGQVLLRPYPLGMRILQETLSPADQAMGAQVLAGFS